MVNMVHIGRTSKCGGAGSVIQMRVDSLEHIMSLPVMFPPSVMPQIRLCRCIVGKRGGSKSRQALQKRLEMWVREGSVNTE